MHKFQLELLKDFGQDGQQRAPEREAAIKALMHVQKMLKELQGNYPRITASHACMRSALGEAEKLVASGRATLKGFHRSQDEEFNQD